LNVSSSASPEEAANSKVEADKDDNPLDSSALQHKSQISKQNKNQHSEDEDESSDEE